MSDPLEEIADAVQVAIAAAGGDGMVIPRGGRLAYRAAGVDASTDATDLAAVWSSLDVAARNAAVRVLAADLLAPSGPERAVRPTAPQGGVHLAASDERGGVRRREEAADTLLELPSATLPSIVAAEPARARPARGQPPGRDPSPPSSDGWRALADDGSAERAAPSADAGAPGEIELAVRTLMPSYGLSGKLVLENGNLELRNRAGRNTIPVAALLEQWPVLPPEIRERKAIDLARALASGEGGSAEPVRARKRTVVVLPVGAILLAILAGLAALRLWMTKDPTPAGDAKAAATAAAAPLDAEPVRRARVCEASRKRLYAGASIGPFDTEGWVVELWLAAPLDAAPTVAAVASAPAGAAPAGPAGSPRLDKHPAVAALAESGVLAPSADAELAKLPNGTLELVDEPPSPGVKARAWASALVRFGGGYAGAFLDPALRPRFVALAERTADAVNADAAALYARCAHLGYRELGAWFRGRDAGGAAAALVFGVGMSAETPFVDRAALDALGPDPLKALRAAAGKLDAAELGTLVGPHGGTVSSPPKKPVTLVFPLGSGRKALSASRALAERLKVAQGGQPYAPE